MPQNPVHPCLHLKIDVLCLFLCSIDGSAVRPQESLQLDSGPISELMWTKPKPESQPG